MGYSIRQNAQERINALKKEQVKMVELMVDLKVRIGLVEEMVANEVGYEKRSAEKALADMKQQRLDLNDLLVASKAEQAILEHSEYKGDRLVLPTILG